GGGGVGWVRNGDPFSFAAATEGSGHRRRRRRRAEVAAAVRFSKMETTTEMGTEMKRTTEMEEKE
uniref:Uncharacterized protein n=1 Tax=Cucumis melo TaxID=3656 RepID=A0A9I9E3P6_CUCME